MQDHEKIDYVEFLSKDIKLTKAFFLRLFGININCAHFFLR